MKKEFTIKVEMEERWISHFMTMLKEMERLGNIGSSKYVGIYSDGDGDFRPKFEADIGHDTELPRVNTGDKILFDAG